MLKSWISALRLKTLPLALGAIILGSRLPKLSFDVEIFAWACLSAVLLQILSNLANDYGDFKKGTDSHRADRQLAGGKISAKSMLIAIVITATLSLISGLILLYTAFGTEWKYWIVFLILGLGSIAAAITYTIGNRAYGYYGLGDLFVFIFFGMVGVVGTAYLYQQTLIAEYFLPAISYGALSVGVLNINNIRDLDKDVLNNKITLAAQMGREGALNYQAFLMITAFLSMGAHHLISGYLSLAPVGIAALGYLHLIQLRKAQSAEEYNALLKFLSLGSLGVVLLFTLRLYF
ncbi:MAG: 1,4-dihydroxy-2-naphthoate octaprenyltransferase [Bacteroidia bacterium]